MWCGRGGWSEAVVGCDGNFVSWMWYSLVGRGCCEWGMVVVGLWLDVVGLCRLGCGCYEYLLGYFDTWSYFEAAKTVPWPSRGLHHFGKFLEPLVE